MNWFNCCSGVVVPPPNCIFKNPSGVYSVMNLFSVFMYLPTFIPALSIGFVGSSIKTVFSTNESTSYHLLVELRNSENVGVF